MGHTIIGLNRWEDPPREFDYLFHLSAYGNHYFQTEEVKIYKANVQRPFDLLEKTKKTTYKGFFNFATTFHNLESGSFYGSTKAAGEYLVRSFVQKYNLPIVNIRPYSIFGEREWNFRFIPTLCNRIKDDEGITVSDVSHDWTYVEDFIDRLIELMPRTKELQGKSVGIGSGTRRSNMQIAKMLMDAVRKEVPIIKGDLRQYEIAAYNQGMIRKIAEQNDEIFIQANQTPIHTALRHVYENPNFLRKYGEFTS